MLKFILSFTFFISSFFCFSIIRYVKPVSSGTGSGLSWINASSDIQSMIQVSSVGDEVWVASGTYKPSTYSFSSTGSQINTSDTRDYTFHVKNGVKIYGGFFGNETLLSQRNLSINVTTLSGDIGIINDVSDNCYHVLQINSNSIVDGFTISKGNANGSNFIVTTTLIRRNEGGGVYMANLNSRLENCIITENNSSSYAGGVKINQNNIIYNCKFTNNTCILKGGAVYKEFGDFDTTRIIKSVFSNNSAEIGGAIYFENGINKIDSTNFSSNTATEGSAIYYGTAIEKSIIINSYFSNHSNSCVRIQYLNAIILNNTFESNNCINGVLYLNNSIGQIKANKFINNNGICFRINFSNNVNIFENTFENNTGSDGCSVISFNSDFLIERNVFTNNQVYGRGGAILLTSSSGFIRNNLFIGNFSSNEGGAIFTSGSNEFILNNTFVNNISSSQLGNVIAFQTSNNTISNNIFYGSTPTILGGLVINNITPSTYDFILNNNRLDGNISYYNTLQLFNNFFYEPVFVNVNDLDGPDNIYRTLDDGVFLDICSPLIDKGDTNFIIGFNDCINNPRLQMQTVDIGAYESSYINNFPENFFISGEGLYCPESNWTSIILDSSQSFYEYDLIHDGLIIDQQIGNGNELIFDSISDFGVYQIMSTSSIGCQLMMTDSIIVGTYTSPVIIAEANPSTICKGNSSELTVTGGINYVWSDTTSVSPETTTEYFVIGYDINGCSDSTSIIVTVNPFELPIIGLNLDTLFVQENYQFYQWLDCDTINNVTLSEFDNTFIPTQNGSYCIYVEAENGCNAYSDCFTINNVGINSKDIQTLILYPIPADKYIVIKGSNIKNIKVFSITGEEVMNLDLEIEELFINVENFPSGIYYFQFNSDLESYSKKLIIEH
jgi:predicted outer membrane repeat protein